MTHVPDSAHIQAHWNSVITATLLRHAVLLELIPLGETSPAKLPPRSHDVIGKLCKELLEIACESQTKHPKLMGRIERVINKRLWNALAIFSAKHLGQWQQLEIDPYPAVEPPIAPTTRVQMSATHHQRGTRR